MRWFFGLIQSILVGIGLTRSFLGAATKRSIIVILCRVRGESLDKD